MEAFETMARSWLYDLFHRDPLAVGLGAGMFIAGSVLTTLGAKLGGRATFALGRVAWAGVRWLFRRRPLSTLALSILDAMRDGPTAEVMGHSLWYGPRLHVNSHDKDCGGDIWLDADTKVNDLLTRAERRRILGQAAKDRETLALRKAAVLGVGRDAETVELNPYAGV